MNNRRGELFSDKALLGRFVLFIYGLLAYGVLS